ncbi:hypothetical protein [Rhodococcus sp. HS-D2]|uniref:hypothetical protein n=1 Tax=Rhodococcus sp. HS-D2 TaxID=1384636 RepID=UPI0007D942F8|nr:hypothetical protein [Rhodococcus sp. HS-D2]
MKKILWGAGAFVAAFVGVLAALYVHDLATGTRFGDTQWAAAGAWVGGIATSLAVGVALLQAYLARKQANKSREDAEELLSKELDAQRRDRQVEAVAEVWEGVSELLGPTLQLTAYLERMFAYQKTMSESAKPQEIARAKHEVALVVKEFVEWFPTFESTITRAEISFTRALMIVDEPNVLILLEDVYQAFIDFKNTLAAAADAGSNKKPYDLDGINKTRTALITKRDPMVKSVRAHLAESRPLRAFRHTLPTDDDQSPEQSA